MATFKVCTCRPTTIDPDVLVYICDVCGGCRPVVPHRTGKDVWDEINKRVIKTPLGQAGMPNVDFDDFIIEPLPEPIYVPKE